MTLPPPEALSPLARALLDAAPAQRRVLIDRCPPAEAAAEAADLAELARGAARARPVEGRQYAEIACALADRHGSDRTRALALRARAVALWAQGCSAEALEAVESAASLAAAADDPTLAAQVPILAIELLAQLGRSEEALSLAEELEERLRGLGAEEDAAKVGANAGNIHFRREAYPEALRCWERALAYFSARSQALPVASLQVNIAGVLTQLARLAEAREMYEAAREALDAAGVEAVAAGIEGNLGYLYFVSGRYTEALRAYERAREWFRSLQLERDVALCDRDIADVYLDLNLVPEARDTYERVIPAFDALEARGEAGRSRLGLAAAQFALGNGEAASAALDRAEQDFRAVQNDIGVARVLLQRAEWWAAKDGPGPSSDPGGGARAEAAACARAALKAFRWRGVKVAELEARLRLATLGTAVGKPLVRSLLRLLREARAATWIAGVWRVEAALARASLSAGMRRGALRHYRAAVEEVERARVLLPGDELRLAFLRDKVRLYGELMALLLDRGGAADLREAFHVAERAKSRTLAELLADPVEPPGSEGADREGLLRQIEELRASLAWDYGRLQQDLPEASRLPGADPELPARVRRLEAEYLRARRQLQLEADGGGSTLPSVPAIEDLQRELAEGEQVVEYVTAGDELLAFVIDRARYRVVRGLASLRDVEAEAARLRFQWSKFGRPGLRPAPSRRSPAGEIDGATRRALEALYELVVEPLEPCLQGERLTVIPHGPLHGVPFHALMAAGEPLIDRWEIAYAPSSAVLRACRRRGEPESTRSVIYGVADEAIPHVRREVACLRGLLDDPEVYQDEEATLASLPPASAWRYLHFATHAVFRQDNPLFSGLRLADGWLVGYDLLRRRLECSMATLSACRTGAGGIVPGDEVLGLARAFLHAGARAVTVSLWSADDAATTELMRRFYSALTAGAGRAAALRTAQQQVRRQFPHPYYWAPFVLIGAR